MRLEPSSLLCVYEELKVKKLEKDRGLEALRKWLGPVPAQVGPPRVAKVPRLAVKTDYKAQLAWLALVRVDWTVRACTPFE